MTAKIGSRLVTAMSSECCFSRGGGIRGAGCAKKCAHDIDQQEI